MSDEARHKLAEICGQPAMVCGQIASCSWRPCGPHISYQGSQSDAHLLEESPLKLLIAGKYQKTCSWTHGLSTSSPQLSCWEPNLSPKKGSLLSFRWLIMVLEKSGKECPVLIWVGLALLILAKCTYSNSGMRRKTGFTLPVSTGL